MTNCLSTVSSLGLNLSVPVVCEMDDDPARHGDDADPDENSVDHLLGEGNSGARGAGHPRLVSELTHGLEAGRPGHQRSC